MKTIIVTQNTENESGWQFDVTVSNDSSTQHTVTLTRDYWQKLTNEEVTPAELIKKSFQFLLEREPKESILRHFDLPIIQTYFPDYKTWITKN